MKRSAALFLAIITAACQDSTVEPKENAPKLRTLSVAESHVAHGTTKFAFNLFKKLQKETPENTFISPLSVSMALAMVLNGASEETQQSIINTIDYSGFSALEVDQAYKDITSLLLSMDNKVELGIANSVWHSQKYLVNPDFSATIREYYDGTVQALDFDNSSSKDVINKWVADKTQDRIKDIIGDIEEDQVMFLINAIYFKGDWTYPFDAKNTTKSYFRRFDGTQAIADLMFSENVQLWYSYQDGNLLLDIPYGNKQFSLTLIMPGTYEQFKELNNTINAEKLTNWLSHSDSVTAELSLPRFKMTWKNDLLTTLESMGMKKSGFPKLFKDPLPLEISSVIHQSYLDVNEKGSEATAVTVIGVIATSAPSKPHFIVDRPFIFMIREKHTGVILFMGQLVDPEVL